MVDSATAYSMMNTAGAPATQANPYGPASSPYAPGAGAVGDIVSALMGYIKANKNPGGLGTFEGNVASPANPLNGGTYGMQPQQPQPDAFSQGASPVPYTDPTMSALFSQPPTG